MRRLHNPDFNYGEYAIIRSQAGLNTYKISVKEWIEKTKAIGLKASAGRYGGTYAHKDIAFEFGMWVSAEFKIYLIKEFQRLKDEENSVRNFGWNIQRILSKVNYRIHTDAIKEALIPPTITREQSIVVYANEADLLNMAIFGQTAAIWRQKNADKSGNIRDEATLEQLVVLTNLESINALLIRQGLPQSQRLQKLNETATQQMRSLLSNPTVKKLDC
ncbi:MAG TPA: KilA-N domain-containing protein [Puia sp.]|nr:KilA-N domain-containing protein [Puia sp.]